MAGPISRKPTLLRTSIGNCVRPSLFAFCGPATPANGTAAGCAIAFQAPQHNTRHSPARAHASGQESFKMNWLIFDLVSLAVYHAAQAAITLSSARSHAHLHGQICHPRRQPAAWNCTHLGREKLRPSLHG